MAVGHIVLNVPMILLLSLVVIVSSRLILSLCPTPPLLSRAGGNNLRLLECCSLMFRNVVKFSVSS